MNFTPSRNAFAIALFIAGISLLCGCANRNQTATKPNVLFIAIDDMNDWTTLFDPNNPIQTPNLERLASRGTFFNKAYCVSPACNPSRTAILTGQHPSTTGVYGNKDSWRTLVPDAVTLPQYFKENLPLVELGMELMMEKFLNLICEGRISLRYNCTNG